MLTSAQVQGYGNCLTKDITNGAHAYNRGAGGRTAESYRTDGHWAAILEDVRQSGNCTPVVTITFGHNDENYKTKDNYRTNLEALCREGREAGAEVILISPCSRRQFAANGTVIDDLGPWSEIMEEVAADADPPVKFVDLNKASVELLNRVGNDTAMTYNVRPGDLTHFSPLGCNVFGNLLASLLARDVPELAPYIKVPLNATLPGLSNSTADRVA